MSHDDTGAVRLSPALHIKRADPKTGTFTGYASTFNDVPDSYGDVIAPGAFSESLAEHAAEGSAPVMLWSHDPAAVVGKWTSLVEDKRGLLVEGTLNLKTTRGKDAHAHLASGDVSGLSIGFYIPTGGRTKGKNGTFLVTKAALVEVSLVAVPSNRNARVTNLKTLTSKSELVDLLREAGLAGQAARRVAAGGWPALAGEDQTKAIELAERIARATAQIRSTK